MKRLRIGVDVRSLSGSMQLAGVSQYTLRLLSVLMRLDVAEFFLYGGSEHRKEVKLRHLFPQMPTRSEIVRSWLPTGLLEFFWDQHIWPIERVLKNVDVFFEPNFFPPYSISVPIVCTIHDLSFLRYPEWFPDKIAQKRAKKIGYTLRSAKAIIAVSKFTKDEIAGFFPKVEEKISVVHEAPLLSAIFNIDHKLYDTREKYRIEGEYILCVGTIEYRKNLSNLIRGYLKLRFQDGTKSQLVLVGIEGYGAREIIETGKFGIEQGWIRLLGYVDQDEIPILYHGAKLFCYLSYYEGFGLPPLEALSCGTPVMVSRVPVFEEILGPHAYYVDPDSISDIAEGISINENSPISTAEERMKWARRYSWESAAQKTLRVFQSIA